MPALFFSYSHRDEALRNELEVHLSMLKREGIIQAWHDRRIGSGQHINEEIDVHLDECEIVLLLISAHFLASDYCYEREMKRALQRAKEGKCTVIPVILHPCDWHSAPFGDLRATPTDGKPISMFGNVAEALAIVARDVRVAASRYSSTVSDSSSDSLRDPPAPHTKPPLPRSSNLRVRREFNDHERDVFLDHAFDYMSRFFEGSLQELEQRNAQIKGRFTRLDGRSFSAAIYDGGRRAAQCAVWCGGESRTRGIGYSSSGDSSGGSYNEMLTVQDDGFALSLKGMGMFRAGERTMTEQGAAEFYWEMLVGPLQDR